MQLQARPRRRPVCSLLWSSLARATPFDKVAGTGRQEQTKLVILQEEEGFFLIPLRPYHTGSLLKAISRGLRGTGQVSARLKILVGLQERGRKLERKKAASYLLASHQIVSTSIFIRLELSMEDHV